jgi:hypothetical protein
MICKDACIMKFNPDKTTTCTTRYCHQGKRFPRRFIMQYRPRRTYQRAHFIPLFATTWKYITIKREVRALSLSKGQGLPKRQSDPIFGRAVLLTGINSQNNQGKLITFQIRCQTGIVNSWVTRFKILGQR